MINAMIASLAIESLVGRIEGDVHRVYVTDEESIRQLNGTVDPGWLERTEGLPRGMKVTTSLPWVNSEDCPLCGAHDAVGS